MHDWLCHLATFLYYYVKGGQVTKPIMHGCEIASYPVELLCACLLSKRIYNKQLHCTQTSWPYLISELLVADLFTMLLLLGLAIFLHPSRDIQIYKICKDLYRFLKVFKANVHQEYRVFTDSKEFYIVPQALGCLMFYHASSRIRSFTMNLQILWTLRFTKIHFLNITLITFMQNHLLALSTSII